jgi:hypothetical protein
MHPEHIDYQRDAKTEKRFHHGDHSAAFGRNQFLPLKTLNSLNTTFYGKESYEYQVKNFLKLKSFAHL